MSDENLNIEDKLQKIKQEIEDRISAIEEKNAELNSISKSEEPKIFATPIESDIQENIKNIEEKEPVKTKKKKKKLLPILIPLLLILLLSFGFFYIKGLKDQLDVKKVEIKKIKDESIDYTKNSYYKEVEDEPEEDELQDFSVYKDVDDPNATNENKDTLNATDSNNIINEVNNKSSIKKTKNTYTPSYITKKNTKSNNNISKIPNTSNINNSAKSNNKLTDNSSNSNTTETTQKKEQPFELYKKEDPKKEVRITSDMMQIIALEHVKGDKYILPKKAKKINSFKVRIRLRKPKRSVIDKPTKIMLVIKDALDKTLKINVKKVNFNNNDLIYTTFYSMINEKIQEDQEYSFYVYANKRLLKIGKKRI